jgi:hypothetical protein
MKPVARILLSFCAVAAGADTAQAACTAAANGDIRLVVTRSLSLGTIAKPTSATALVRVGADGTRVIPGALTIASDAHSANPARAPGAAAAEITGGPGCGFRITLAGTTGTIANTASFLPASGYALSSAASGAQGTLGATGKFAFTIGTEALIGPATSAAGGTIILQVSYF